MREIRAQKTGSDYSRLHRVKIYTGGEPQKQIFVFGAKAKAFAKSPKGFWLAAAA